MSTANGDHRYRDMGSLIILICQITSCEHVIKRYMWKPLK